MDLRFAGLISALANIIGVIMILLGVQTIGLIVYISSMVGLITSIIIQRPTRRVVEERIPTPEELRSRRPRAPGE